MLRSSQMRARISGVSSLPRRPRGFEGTSIGMAGVLIMLLLRRWGWELFTIRRGYEAGMHRPYVIFVALTH